MNKLITSTAVLPLCLFLTSCNAYFNASTPSEFFDAADNKNVDVMKIHTSTDGLVYFSNKYPGKMLDGEISGVKQVPLKLFATDSVVYKVKRLKEIPIYAYSNGSKFDIFKNNDIDMVYTTTLINVPVTEVSNMELKKDGKRTAVFSGLVVGIAALSVYIISNMTINVGDRF